MKEGYDFDKYEEKDTLYFYSKKDANYVPMTAEMVSNIDSGSLQF